MKNSQLESGRDYLEKKLESQPLKFLYDEEKSKSEIARMVRNAREKAGLSQRELAELANTTQAVIARLELGNDQRMPSLQLISKLLRASGAKLELVCTFDDVA